MLILCAEGRVVASIWGGAKATVSQSISAGSMPGATVSLGVPKEFFSHGSDQRIFDSAAANGSVEVVHVHAPNHGAGVAVDLDPVHFVTNCSFVIKSDLQNVNITSAQISQG